MTDTHSKATRSYNMSRIKSKDTTPEMVVRRYLFKLGFRYRLHKKNLPGKPDIVLKKFKTVVFIHGCFWHGHNECRYFVKPKSNQNYWLPKIEKNISRGLQNEEKLKMLGWKVIKIWECELKTAKRDTLEKLTLFLTAPDALAQVEL